MTQNRKPLDFTSFPNVIKSMIEDSAEAATVIDKLIELKGESSSLATLILLDDMNIRGIQIQSLYKLCEENIKMFYNAILNMTEEGIEILNKTSAPFTAYKAVFAGTTEDREKYPEKYIMTSLEREKYTSKKNEKKTEEENQYIKNDLYPTIKIEEALKIITQKGFKCGYKKDYINNHEQETYWIFYNKKGDIIQTISQNNKNIFLWEDAKLYILKEKNNTNYISCIIDLKNHPFKTYDELLENKKQFTQIQQIPVIKTIKGIEFNHQNPSYKSLITSSIYDLLMFETTYQEIDENLKQIFSSTLKIADDLAYDEIIFHLNADDGIEIAINIQNILGYNLSQNKLLKAKDRFSIAHGHKASTEQKRFVSKLMSGDPYTQNINHRIIDLLNKNVKKVTSD